MKRVLLVYSYKKNKLGDNDALLRRLKEKSQQYGYDIIRGALKEMIYSIRDNKLSVFDTMNQHDVAEYDLVFFRMWYKERDRAAALAHFLKSKNIPFFDSDTYSNQALSKLTENFLLAEGGVPVIDSVFSTPKHSVKLFKENPPFAFPFIVKSIHGLKGRNNYLVHETDELAKVLTAREDVTSIIQPYIANDCDYRFLIFGDEIKLVLRRTRLGNSTHVNNTSQGARAEAVPLKDFSEDIKRDAIKAAAILQRDFSGVDVLIDKHTGKHYILEVNSVPEVLSVYIDEKLNGLHEYIHKRLEV